MQKIAIIIALMLPFCSLSGQSKATQGELFEDGEYFFKRSDYEEAVYYYLQLLRRYPDNPNFNYKAGECYLNIPGKESLAIPYFEKAITNVTDKNIYNEKDINEKHAPLHAYFYLGNAYRVNNELDKALESYEAFINHRYYDGNYNLTVVENEIEASERAKIIKDSPVKLLEQNVGSPINTVTKNTYPVISKDETLMVYVTGLQFYDAIFSVARNKDGTWSTPINITPQVGSDGDLFPTYLSPDGTKLIMVKKQPGNDDLYFSTLINNEWSKALPLESINTRGNESYASLSDDGKILVFTSDRRSMGGSDIFICNQNEDHTWSKPINIGEAINTVFNEAAPYFANNGNTLYFSSQGHYNMGGYDIFYSNKNAKGDWNEPINIGYPINNTGDNTYFYPLHRGEIGYMSVIKTEGMGESDIYRLEIQSNLTHMNSK